MAMDSKTVVCELRHYAFCPRFQEGIQPAPVGLSDKPLWLPRVGLTGVSLQAAASRDPFFASFRLAQKAGLAQKAAPSFLSIRLAGVAKAYHIEFTLARAAFFYDIVLRFLVLSAVQKHTASAYGFFGAWRLENKKGIPLSYL